MRLVLMLLCVNFIGNYVIFNNLWFVVLVVVMVVDNSWDDIECMINVCIDNIGNFVWLVNFIDIVLLLVGVICVWIWDVFVVCREIFC